MTTLEQAARRVVVSTEHMRHSFPHVCCMIGCAHRGETSGCDHDKHPSGWVGWGAEVWDDIEQLRKALYGDD